jgi:thiamine biosynthesis lipoprotein
VQLIVKFEIWGMSGTLVTEHEEQLPFAESRLWHWLDAFDASCNRFRPDSELSRLNRDGHVALSSTLELALRAALDSFEATNGMCDPTVLPALVALGYDVDFAQLADRPDRTTREPIPSLGARAITLDLEERRASLAPGCQVDLGASAKALVVDLVARDVASSGGVLVELGGDVAVHGRGPTGPWSIGVSDTLVITGLEPRISVTHGGLATSSTKERSWVVSGRPVHHIIDPRTGASASGPYVTATVSGESCVRANAFATAALIWGEDAGYYLAQSGCAARLVRRDGSLDFVGGWPQDVAAA